MAAGITFKPKRKAGAFSGGELAAGEVGLDTTNRVWYYSSDGSTVVVLGSGSGTGYSSVAYLTSTFTDTGTTMGNVTGMSFSASANKDYWVEIVGFWDTSVVTSGMNFEFSGPTSPDYVLYNCGMFTGGTTFRTNATAAMATAFSTTLLQGNSPGTGGCPFFVWLYLENGANAGTVQFRATNEAGSTTLNLYRGTTMKVLQLN